MKKFENPEVQVEELEIEDVVTASVCDRDCPEFSCDWHA